MNVADLHKKAVESQYKGICTVYEYQKVKDDVTKVTATKEILVLEGVPCNLSYKSIATTGENNNAATVSQAVKLFCALELCIKAGSKIVVTQAGITTAYKSSGAPAVYPSHQEIALELFERWA